MVKTAQNKEMVTKPSIVGFICNWGAYSGLEMAGFGKKEYTASIKLVKVMCLGRVNLGLMLKAFELGADGVLLLGCPPQECHYDSGSERAKELLIQLRKTLQLLGIDPKRAELIEVPSSRDDVFVRKVSAFARYLNKTNSEKGPVSARDR